MEKREIKYLLSIVIAVLFAIGCILTQGLLTQENPDATSMQNTMKKDLYNGYGLEIGTQLSDQIVYESEELVCYKDRVFRRFQYHVENADRVAAMAEGVLFRCPSIENVYVLPVPNNIFWETGNVNEEKQYQQFLDRISGNLPSRASLINVLPVLQEHREEYIFFRTDDSWTAKGAYYGMEEMCRVTGLKAIPLDQYEEYMYNSFTGSLALQEEIRNIENLFIPGDRTYYYLLPGSDNRVEIMDTDSSGKTICYKKPLITSSVADTGSFIAPVFTRAIVEGDTDNEKTKDSYILVVCDECGKMLVPYLKDYYDGVYVINIKEDDDFFTDIKQIVDAYHITEVVFSQNALKMGASGYYRALSDFCEKE